MSRELLQIKISELITDLPWITDFFTTHSIDTQSCLERNFTELTESLDDDFFQSAGCSRTGFCDDFILFIEQMQSLQDSSSNVINELSIMPGFDKDGIPEKHSVEIMKGDITAIVGPTGSGKSRLLEDIECLAQGDTPTGRSIKINGQIPDEELRFASDKNLVAQLSQNMNFVMDLSVKDFLTMHCESRMIIGTDDTVKNIYSAANELAGEKFTLASPLTQLSGGQSRALMIADTALLSASPIILIDEIENAGVDKIKSLDLLKSSEKIILISTHDPLIALSATRRIIIKNGGISSLVETSGAEQAYLPELQTMDEKISTLRQMLRRGEYIS